VKPFLHPDYRVVPDTTLVIIRLFCGLILGNIFYCTSARADKPLEPKDPEDHYYRSIRELPAEKNTEAARLDLWKKSAGADQIKKANQLKQTKNINSRSSSDTSGATLGTAAGEMIDELVFPESTPRKKK
jgi:hypothetical protein